MARGRGLISKEFQVKARVDAPLEIEYLKNGGVLNYVLRNFMRRR
jgi:aconitate hydratase